MTNEEAKEFLDNLKICINEHPVVADWLVEIENRKTENSSEKPNNCEGKNYCDDCLYTDTCDSKEFFYACTSKATISKMEQVDKDINVRSKDEPQYDFGEYADRLWKIAYERGKREALEQTEPSCETCKLKDTTEWCKRQEVCRAYQPTDEPQTEEHCENCRHKDKCEGATYEYKNTEWWCLAYAPIDEPQTDCAWK